MHLIQVHRHSNMPTAANTSPTVVPKYMTYMGGRQLQHQKNVNRREYHFDCSSEEKTHFQYIPHYSGELDQTLVQKQQKRQQRLLYGEIICYNFADLCMFGD